MTSGADAKGGAEHARIGVLTDHGMVVNPRMREVENSYTA
jgi:hypothetical protein